MAKEMPVADGEEMSRFTEIEPGDRVLVTGAAGFVGSSVTRVLLDRGAHVVALLQPGADQGGLDGLDGLDVERVEADVRDAAGVAKAVDGARFVFHVAALYRFWAADPDEFYSVNVGGTLNVLGAAAEAGCERVVYTSTVGTIGLDATSSGEPATETDWPRIEHLFGSYKRSKYVAEHEVLRAAAAGQGIVLCQPTLPVGPRDRAPTPTGRIVLDFLNGRIPGWFDTALNAVDVEDVAAGHVAALEWGRQGRSYVLGGENMTFKEILDTLAAETGLPTANIKVPAALALGAAHVSELVEGRLARRAPTVPLEGARMATTRMIFSDARARAEIGYKSRPAREALERSARWFADNGYVVPKRLERIRWRSAAPTAEA
jgi:dihydroflavonol-4-reductase